MQTRSSRAYSWNRFATPHLSIVAALEGTGHEFAFEGASVRVKLPAAARAGDEDDGRMLVTEWSADDAPMRFTVLDVDVEVDQQNTPDILALVESSGPARDDISLIPDLEAFAGRAFQHWLRMVRWRTKNWRVGRLSTRQRSSLGCTLYEHRTNRRLASGRATIAATNDCHLALEEWADIQTTLAARLPPPVFYDMYFDGREHLANKHLARAVVDFANACEVMLKILLERRLSAQHYDTARAFILRTEALALINGIAPSLLEPCIAGVLRTHRPVLERLFAARSAVLQSDQSGEPAHAQCVEFSQATAALLSAGEGPSSDRASRREVRIAATAPVQYSESGAAPDN